MGGWDSCRNVQAVSFEENLVVRTLSYIRVLGVIELIEFNHSGLDSFFGVIG